MILRRALQTRTQNRPKSTSRNRLDSPHPITEPPTKQTTAQRAQVINRDNPALQQRIGDDRCGLSTLHLGVPELHQLDVVLGVVHAGHHALVIAEEEDGQRGDAVDCNEELALLELVDDIPRGDSVAHFDAEGG